MVEITIDENIFVPNAPAVPGLTFRGFRGEPDYANILAVIDGCKEVDQVERSDTLEDIATSANQVLTDNNYPTHSVAEY